MGHSFTTSPFFPFHPSFGPSPLTPGGGTPVPRLPEVSFLRLPLSLRGVLPSFPGGWWGPYRSVSLLGSLTRVRSSWRLNQEVPASVREPPSSLVTTTTRTSPVSPGHVVEVLGRPEDSNP